MNFVHSVLQELGRHNYVTPTSYLELITCFKTLLEAKRTQVNSRALALARVHLCRHLRFGRLVDQAIKHRNTKLYNHLTNQ
jgi:hypothetical protein